MLTLRQIEVIRAIMVTGTIAGAAKLLNVSAPGLSRLMKYSEQSLGIRLFDRRGGRYVPTPQARNIFDLLDSVHRKIADLESAVADLGTGRDQELCIASVPSIASVVFPRAVGQLSRRFADLGLNISILKIEEAIDYLLLGRGEMVAMSSSFDHPLISFETLAIGRLVCIVAENSPLATNKRISPQEMAAHPLIGIDPRDPYGAIMTSMFARSGVDYRMNIKARFGSTVCSLVAEGLGIAIIDEFTIAHGNARGIKAIEIEGDSSFRTYAAFRSDVSLSAYAEEFIRLLRIEMEQATASRAAEA